MVDKDLLRLETEEARGRPLSPLADRRDDSLMASPLVVNPYPQRPMPKHAMTLDSPAKKHVENVYDRCVDFFMA